MTIQTAVGPPGGRLPLPSPHPCHFRVPQFLPVSGTLSVDVSAGVKTLAPTPDDLQAWGRKQTALGGREHGEALARGVTALRSRGPVGLICHLRTCYSPGTLQFTHAFVFSGWACGTFTETE